ncbi:hypothetical protein GUJ93_ZPchr0013g36212 [Zizania palustris]|uniref:Uncharacterized protein n=1 Tax=Zizania palustris TaxID=103762 RepID=A0A8J6BXY9_ZIZPA|nr:hypothetical protein GUJ93_ZPchr0013g36212 [Zizania palustris]
MGRKARGGWQDEDEDDRFELAGFSGHLSLSSSVFMVGNWKAPLATVLESDEFVGSLLFELVGSNGLGFV